MIRKDNTGIHSTIPSLQLNINNTTFSTLIAEMNAICDHIEKQVAHIVIIQFSLSVSNLETWPGDVTIQEINRWERTLRRLEQSSAFVIAVAESDIYGAALELLLITDYRIATTHFKLHAPKNKNHIWPGMAFYRLINQIGVAYTRQFMMSDQKIAAQRAFDIGLIDEITDNPQAVLQTALARFHAMSGKEHAIHKQLLLEATSVTFENALGTHLAACDRELRRLKKPETIHSMENS